MRLNAITKLGAVAALCSAAFVPGTAGAHWENTGWVKTPVISMNFRHEQFNYEAELRVGWANAAYVKSLTNANYKIAVYAACFPHDGGSPDLMFIHKSGTVSVSGANQWAGAQCPAPQFFGSIKYGMGWVGH